jgi:hypothetical protein
MIGSHICDNKLMGPFLGDSFLTQAVHSLHTGNIDAINCREQRYGLDRKKVKAANFHAFR